MGKENKEPEHICQTFDPQGRFPSGLYSNADSGYFIGLGQEG